MLWETSQQLTNLPPLPHDSRRFIAAFLNVDQDTNELSNELNEDFFDVVQRLCDPAIKAWITAINALKSNERRERALAALDTALTNEHNPNNIRRAATRILRHFELTRPRAIEVVNTVDSEKREGGNPTTSMRTTRDVDTKIAPKSTTQPVVEKSQSPTPDLSESPSEGPGQMTQISPNPNTALSPSALSASSAVKSIAQRNDPHFFSTAPLGFACCNSLFSCNRSIPAFTYGCAWKICHSNPVRAFSMHSKSGP